MVSDTIAITVVGGANTTIRALTVEGGRDGINSSVSLVLKNIHIQSTGRHGIACGGGSLEFSDGTIERTESDGINCSSANLTINRVTITRSGGSGIGVGPSTSLTLNEGVITRSRRFGLSIENNNINVVVRKTIITVNVGHGVWVNTCCGGNTTVDLGTAENLGENEIFLNGAFNVQVGSEGSAIGNWWGSDPPNAAQISGVEFEAWLSEPPLSSTPAIHNVEPFFGSLSGGTVIKITGLRFIAGATVTIGGNPATGVSVDSDTQITAVTPVGVKGSALLTVTNPDGGSTSLQEGFTYVDLGGGQASDTFEAEISLTKGVNIFSLPLRPEVAVTASQLGTDLDATVVLRAVDGKFLVYVPDGDFGTDFPLEVGKGVIVNLLEPKTYKATGRAWGTPVIAAPVQSAATGTWAFVVAGRIDSSVVPHAKVRVMNLRTGESQVVPISASGKFTAAFVDMTKQAVVTPGDAIVTQLIDSKGTPFGDAKKHLISPDQIARANLKTRLSATPQQTQLLQNYPNPFNPETWIPFQLAGDLSHVVIGIYDLTGRQIRRLDVGHRGSGWYLSRDRAAYWDGKNIAGEHVSSGVYFYQLRTDDFSAQRKLVIVK